MSTEYDVTRAIKRIENELIDSMIRNFKRHRVEEGALGMDWEQWQVLQLKALNEYRKYNFNTFTEDFSDINKRIEEALRTTYDNAFATEEATILKDITDNVTRIDLDKAGPEPIQGEFFGINKSRLDHLIDATETDFSRGEFAMLRQADDEYRRIIFDAQVYAGTGATYEQAVDMATKDFLRAGIQSITYKNGARHKMSDYARMAIRTGQKRAYLMGCGDARDKHGIHTVRVNKRTQACPQCVKWLNRVLVDDVYSGGTAQEAKHLSDLGMPVPLLSQAIAEGFLHPNCKDIYSTYIPFGSDDLDSSLHEGWTQEELQDLADKYNLEQELNRARDMEESYARMARNTLSDDKQEAYRRREEEWRKRREEIQRKLNEGNKKPSGDWQVEPEVEDEIRTLIKEPLISTGDDPWDSAPELPRSWFGKDFYVDHEVTFQESIEIKAGDYPELMEQLKARGIEIGKTQIIRVGTPNKKYTLGYNDESGPKVSYCGQKFKGICQDRDKIFVGECYAGRYAWRGYSGARADRMDISFTRRTGKVVETQVDCVFAKDKGRTKTVKMFFSGDRDYWDDAVDKSTSSGYFAYPNLDGNFVWSEELKQRVDYVSKQLWDEGIPYRMFRHRGTGGRNGLSDKEAFQQYQKANGAFMHICKCDYIPTEITKEEYVGLKCKPLYRGVSNSGLRGDFKDVTCRDMIENFLQGELFASRGIYGDGASYHAINYYTSKNIYANGVSENVFELKLKDGAKTIKYNDAVKLCERIHKANPDGDKLFFSPDQRGGYEVGKAMTILGYDCIIEPNGDGGGMPFYIPLSRGVLRYYRKPKSEGGDPYLLTPYTGRRFRW